MIAPDVDGIAPFKIAGRSISGWIPNTEQCWATEKTIWEVEGGK